MSTQATSSSTQPTQLPGSVTTQPTTQRVDVTTSLQSSTQHGNATTSPAIPPPSAQEQTSISSAPIIAGVVAAVIIISAAVAYVLYRVKRYRAKMAEYYYSEPALSRNNTPNIASTRPSISTSQETGSYYSDYEYEYYEDSLKPNSTGQKGGSNAISPPKTASIGQEGSYYEYSIKDASTYGKEEGSKAISRKTANSRPETAL